MLNLSSQPKMVTPSHFLRTGSAVAGLVVLAWLLSSLPLSTTTLLAATAFTAALLLLRWPWLIWPAMALLLPFTAAVRGGPLSANELIVLVATGLWLLDGARRDSLVIYTRPVVLLPLLYAAVLLLSLLRAPGLGEGIAEVVKWAEFALIVALLPAMTARNNAHWTVAALVAGATAQALLGLYQFAFQVGPEWFVLFDRYMRASGTFRQPNPYAGYLGIVLPIAISLALWALRRAFATPEQRVARMAWAAFYTGSAVVIFAGLLASWSRGGWLAAAAGVAVVVIIRTRWAAVLGAILGVAAVLTGASALISASRLPPQLQIRLQGMADILRPGALLAAPVTDDNFALIERLAHWVAGYRMWAQAPWWGIGAGNYERVYDQVNLPVWTEPLGHAHNLYLNILAETGLIGMAAFLTFWLGLAIWTVAQVRLNDENAGWNSAVAAGVLGAMTYLTIHSVVDVLFVQGIYLALALPVAALAAAGEVNRSAARSLPAASAYSWSHRR